LNKSPWNEHDQFGFAIAVRDFESPSLDIVWEQEFGCFSDHKERVPVCRAQRIQLAALIVFDDVMLGRHMEEVTLHRWRSCFLRHQQSREV
jgi:hypothetical protein